MLLIHSSIHSFSLPFIHSFKKVNDPYANCYNDCKRISRVLKSRHASAIQRKNNYRIFIFPLLLSAPDQKDWKIIRSIADSFVVKPRTVEMTLITLESFAIGIKTEFRVEFIGGELLDVGRRNRVSQHDHTADAIRRKAS